MRLKEVLRRADVCAYRECKKRHWPLDDDTRQDVRIKVWVSFKENPSFSTRLIPTIAQRAVIDHIRKEIGRPGVSRPRIINQSIRDWAKVRSDITDRGHRLPLDLLDWLEEKLGDEDIILFHHMRKGHTAAQAAKAMGLKRNTTWRRMGDVLARSRALIRELNGE